MEIRKILITLIFSLSLIIILLSIVLSLRLNNAKLNLSTPPSDASCKILQFSNKEAVDILFFSDKEKAKEYVDYLLSIEPFKSYKDAFNFYYIDDYKPLCEIYKDIALLCNSKEIIKKASVCPYDYIVVLQNAESNIRSSSYNNIMSLNLLHPISVFSHEFGHAFASLDDEYVPASLSFFSKNCGKSCSKFEKVTKECYKGCSKEDYFRSVENGIMKTLSSNNYGTFNKRIIESLLQKKSVKISGSAIKEQKEKCVNMNYYIISAKAENGNLKVLSKEIERGCFPDYATEGLYSYTMQNKEGEKINTEKINDLFRIFSDEVEENKKLSGGALDVNETKIYLVFPYIKEAEKLTIEDIEGNKITEIQLGDKLNKACKR
ncbi:MAG: M64 family metallopeptidase [Candidatus Pacearchaeota archaeon]